MTTRTIHVPHPSRNKSGLLSRKPVTVGAAPWERNSQAAVATVSRPTGEGSRANSPDASLSTAPAMLIPSPGAFDRGRSA